MNGLTAANVELIIDAIKEASTELLKEKQFRAAKELQSVCEVIEQMQRDNTTNTTQASRPDRVGDECWYATWDLDNGRWDWRRGVLRSWIAGNNPAAIEDIQTGQIEYKSEISFSAEAPK
jgi:hypothetical protein